MQGVVDDEQIGTQSAAQGAGDLPEPEQSRRSGCGSGDGSRQPDTGVSDGPPQDVDQPRGTTCDGPGLRRTLTGEAGHAAGDLDIQTAEAVTTRGHPGCRHRVGDERD